VWESNDSTNPFDQAASIDVTTHFIDPQLLNAPSSIFPQSPPSSGSIEPAEFGAVVDWNIFPELGIITQDQGNEFGSSNYPTSSSSHSEPGTRSSTPTSCTNYGTKSFHRGPGRPKNSERERYAEMAKGRSAISARRQLHNNSAMRSRLKLNIGLDQLWGEVPEQLRVQALGGNLSRHLSRADKLEVVLLYMRIMQTKVKSAGPEI
jgi:hypothetical protein